MTWVLAVKVVRSRHLILPAKTPIETVQCEVYYPVCGLVEIKTRLEAFTNNTLISYEKVSLLGVQCINLFGYIGFLSSWISLLWFIVGSNRVDEPAGSQVAVAVLGIVMTTVFFTMHLCHASLVLLGRLLVSLDAWFVSINFTIITIAVCDVVRWDRRGIFVLPPWLWCHWVMILDSFTPLTKRRLVLRPSLVTTTTLMLVLYPAVLAY